MLNRRPVDNSIEEEILTGLIVSTKYIRDVSQLVKGDYFVVPYAKVVSKWCLDHYKKYKQAPGELIQNIFNVEQGKLKEGDANIVSSFLAKLSSKYETAQNFNAEYLYDKSIRYFRKRGLKIASDNVQSLLDLDRVEEAETEMQGYRKVVQATSGWQDLFDEEQIRTFFLEEEDRSQKLFKLPGKLGDMIGDFERNWLFAIMGPAKKGKTFWLGEIAVQALLEKYKVIFFSLEMDKHRMRKRLQKRLTAFGDYAGEYVYPCFDCFLNQNGSCKKKERENTTRLLDEEGSKPEYGPDIDYSPCTQCRGKKKSDYLPATWFTTYKKEKMKFKNTKTVMRGLKEMYGNNFKFKAYPIRSANLSQILGDISDLEEMTGFVPDVIVIDYADILAPEDSRVIGRDRLDETWQALKNLSDVRHCLVVTASQTNRASFKRKNVTQTDVSEDIRKIAHVDGLISLNQTPAEKRESIMRIAQIAGRDSNFDQFKTCTVLQQLELGQVCLDSELFFSEKTIRDFD
jgi:replicative DNA helicase